MRGSTPNIGREGGKEGGRERGNKEERRGRE